MTETLRVIDDALPLAIFDGWADYAHTVDFATVTSPTDGQAYRNVALPPPGMTLHRHLERAMGRSVFWAMEFLRYGEPGDGAANIHCDVGYPSYASVLYLNTPEELQARPSGTAFYRHKALGLDRLVDPHQADTTLADMTHPAAWDVTYIIPAVTNRLIVYPTTLFHARHPLDPAPGRLVHVAFFDLI